MNENLMLTETDIMKNLNLHLKEKKDDRKRSTESVPFKANFQKQRTNSEAKTMSYRNLDSQQRRFTSRLKRKKVNIQAPSNKYISKKNSKKKSVPLAGLGQQKTLKESHFFDMIDQMQKQTRQLASQKNLLNQESESNWYESITNKKQF